jgi:rhodanese-related sulfurtransferase
MMNGFEVAIDEVKARMKSGGQLFFVNVRHHQDWDLAVMKVRGAPRVPDNEVEKHLDEIPRDRTIIVYSTCPGDEGSIRAAQMLQQHGWNDVHPLVGGF